MDYKQVLKLASAKQEAAKEMASSSILLKDLGPPKKEEKPKKGINSPGVKAFLEKLKKSEQRRSNQEIKMSSSGSKTPSSSTEARDDLDVNNLFKKTKRVALLPDSAVLNMMEISKLRNQHLREKHESQKAKEIKEKSEREKLKEAEKSESDKRETLKRVMNILNAKQQSAGVKRSMPVGSSQPEVKKCKLDDKNKTSNGFKIPRKSGPSNSAPRLPPMGFDELLKVAERNQKEQPTADMVKEILCVDLLNSNNSKDKDQENKREKNGRETYKNSTDPQERHSLSSSSSFNNKSNHPAPHSMGSVKSKTNVSASKCSVQSSTGAFKKTSTVTNSNKIATNTARPSGGSTGNRVEQCLLSSKPLKKDNVQLKQQSLQVKSASSRPMNGKPTNSNKDVICSGNKNKPSLNDKKVMETIAKSLNVASDSMRKDLMEFLKKYKQGLTSDDKKVVKSSLKNSSTSADVKPSAPNHSRPPEKKPMVNGWERAMSALAPRAQKSAEKVKQLNASGKNYEDYDDDEEDDDMDDFIDDTEADIDYSSHIKSIFNYDKSKYIHDEDDDDECMESNHREIEREERISAKIGMMEDLEDIRMEQEELKRKKLKKMGKR